MVVDRELEKIDPAANSFLFGFARDNELTLRAGRNKERPEGVAPAPVPAGAAGEGV